MRQSTASPTTIHPEQHPVSQYQDRWRQFTSLRLLACANDYKR